jgi:hypothetical protein
LKKRAREREREKKKSEGNNSEIQGGRCNIYRFSPYLTGNKFYLRWRAKPVNAV